MLHNEALSLLFGAVVLGAVHGIELGHGWPVAAAYALNQTNKWLYAFVSSLIIGVGHLISSLAMVAVFFYAKSYFSLTQINKPIAVFQNVGVADIDTLTIGGPVSLVAGILLILLGIREYTSHSHEDGHTHGEVAYVHQEHDHSPKDGHNHDHETDSTASLGLVARVKNLLTSGGHSHDHDHEEPDQAAERGLFGIAWFAFLLGFAHEEEFEIIAMCAGSQYCLELMSAYAITVILGIVGLTMVLVAGYTHYKEKVEQFTPYLPTFSAAVLILMGLGFITGLY